MNNSSDNTRGFCRLAHAVWEGLRTRRLPPDLPPLGQIHFNSA
jgi:hypothetical protein